MTVSSSIIGCDGELVYFKTMVIRTYRLLDRRLSDWYIEPADIFWYSHILIFFIYFYWLVARLLDRTMGWKITGVEEKIGFSNVIDHCQTGIKRSLYYIYPLFPIFGIIYSQSYLCMWWIGYCAMARNYLCILCDLGFINGFRLVECYPVTIVSSTSWFPKTHPEIVMSPYKINNWIWNKNMIMDRITIQNPMG